MKIAFNPSTVAALTAPPNNKDITFDLRGRNIFARGVKFLGTDTNTWRDIKVNNVSIGSHTLDLRNGSNTTLTNTNGIVTINSTWRPVVDNLTSNSTTSSLSANLGRVLAGLINTLGTNISNLYALRDGSNATGRWQGGLACFDVRDTNYTPHDLNMGLKLLFLKNSTNNLKDGGEYNGVFSFRQWAYGSDWSGGKAHLLSFTDNENIWHRTSSGDDSWGAWKKLAYSTDIPSSLKNPHALTISLNGTSQGPYDGSAAKNINITPGSIGAATSGHTHDGRYLKLTGGTLTGNLIGTAAMFSGRFYGNGDDEGIIIKPSSNGYAGLILGTHDGERSVFYFTKNNPFWRYNNGSANLDIYHPRKSGTIALTSDIPNKNSWNYDDRYYTKAESNAKYITDITTSVNKLTFTRNGANVDKGITVNVVCSLRNLTNIPNNDATTKASSGLFIYDSYNLTIGTNPFSSVLSINTGGTIQIAGNWGDDLPRNLYWRSLSDRAVSSYPWKSWRIILDSENYPSILDSRYYTESEVDSLLDAKLNRQNLSYGAWNPRGYNLAADYSYNGGDLSISENSGKIFVSIDGSFWLNEGRYRVLDTSDIGDIRGSITILLCLSNSDTNWYPLIWGGDNHRNTYTSTGAVYKSHDVLSWLTSSLTLYATHLRTTYIDLENNRGIFLVTSGGTSPLKGIKLPDLQSNGIGMFSKIGDGNGADEGGIIISADTSVIYNSFDTGWGLSVRDKDRGLTDISGDGTIAFGIRQDYRAYSLGGFEKSGSNNSYVLLGGGDHKLESALRVSNADTVDGFHASSLFRDLGWWTNSETHDANDITGNGAVFAYSTHSNVPTTGVLVTFRGRSDGYRWQMAKSYANRTLYIRQRNGDNGIWSNWLRLLDENDLTWGNITGKPSSFTPSAHNHDGRYLRLDGSDTMTGVLKVKANQFNDGYNGAINMNNSNIYGLNSIYTADRSDDQTEGLHFWRDSTHVDTLRMMDGKLLFTPNRPLGGSGTEQTVLHTGNSHIKGSTITINGSSITPLTSLPSHTHTYIVAEDLRSKYPGQILDPKSMKLSFLAASTLGIKDGSYYDVITVRSYADHTGGSDNALLFSKNTNSLYHTRFAFGSTDSWGNPLLIIDSGNIGSQSVAYASKAGSVAWGNVSGRPSSLKNPYSLTTFGVVYDGSAAKTVTTSTFIGLVSEATATITDGTMLITSWASDSGFADTNAVNVPYKRKAVHLWEYIKAKTDTLYSSKSHTHSYLPLAGGTMNANARISHGDGNLYIGRADNNGWVYTQDIASHAGTDKWNIRTSGAASFGSIHIASKTDASFNSNVIECGSSMHLNYFNGGNITLCNGGGKVGIGKSDPLYKLDVAGNGRFQDFVYCNAVYSNTLNHTSPTGHLIIGNKTKEISIRSSYLPDVPAVYLYQKFLTNVYYTANKGFGIRPYYLSSMDYRPTETISGNMYSVVTVGDSVLAISCIIADKANLISLIRGTLIRFLPGDDGLIVLLKDLNNYGSINGYFYVLPKGCSIIRSDNSNVYIADGNISDAYDDGKSRFFIYAKTHKVWIEFYCG